MTCNLFRLLCYLWFVLPLDHAIFMFTHFFSRKPENVELIPCSVIINQVNFLPIKLFVLKLNVIFRFRSAAGMRIPLMMIFISFVSFLLHY